jgi:hypothetical protein
MSLEPEHIKLLRDIHTAMVGNDLGTTGLINRMNTVEKKTSENKKQINNIKSTSVLYGTGAGTGVSAIILGFKAWWMSKFGG